MAKNDNTKKNEDIDEILKEDNEFFEAELNGVAEDVVEAEEVITSDNLLQDRIDELEKELALETERKLVAFADLENYKRRILKEREDMSILANSMVLNMLLEVLSDLNRATDQMEEPPVGLTMIGDKINSELETQGIEKIEVNTGDIFDPKVMEAVGTVAVQEEDQDGKVVHVDQTGYRLKDKEITVRGCRVIVGKFSK